MITLREIAGLDDDAIQTKTNEPDPLEAFMPWATAIDPNIVPPDQRENVLRFNKKYLIDRLLWLVTLKAEDPTAIGIRAAVTRHLFGLDGLKTWTAVAELMGVSKGRISQVAKEIKHDIARISKEIRDFGEPR